MKWDFLAHSMGVRGSFILIGIIGLLLALLFAPLSLHLRLAVTLRGGRGSFTLRLLLVYIRFLVRVHLFEEPYFSVEFINKNGKMFRLVRAADDVERKSPAWVRALFDALKLKSAGLNATLGLGAAAETALACGALSTAAREALCALFPDTKLCIDVVPQYSQRTFLLKIDGIATVHAVHIIQQRLKQRGDESHGASVGNHFAGHGVGAKESC